MKDLHAAKICMGILVLIMAAPAVFAGYIEDREAAMELTRKRATQAALNAFNKMAQGEDSSQGEGIHQETALGVAGSGPECPCCEDAVKPKVRR